MIPVDQEFMWDGATGQRGDCFRACLASILELPIADVPHFAQLAKNNAAVFWNMVYDWLEERGYDYVYRTAVSADRFDESTYHILSGPSPRGVHHAVVGKGGQIAHDPHPSRAGLIGDPAAWNWAYLVKREAA